MTPTLKIGEKTKKFFAGEIIKADEEDHTITGVASHESVDRDGDIIKQEGWDLKNIKKNPVMLWGHEYHGLPIAKIIKIWVEGKKLMFKAKFAGLDQAHPFAETVYQMMRDGFLKAFSVGFIPKELHPNPKTSGYFIDNAELLEVSVVTVPSHPNAVVQNIKSFAENSDQEDALLKFLKSAMIDDKPTELVADPAPAEAAKSDDEEKTHEEKIKFLTNLLTEKHEELKSMRKYFAIFSKATGVERTEDELGTIDEIGLKTIALLKTIDVLNSKTKKEIAPPEANRPATPKARTADDVESDLFDRLAGE